MTIDEPGILRRRLGRLFLTPLLGLGLCFASLQAHAGIILGDSVDVAIHAPTFGEVCFLCGGVTQVNVVEGDSDAIEPYLPGGNWFTVDVNSESISITFNRDLRWQSASFIGLVISDINFMEGAVSGIPGVVLSSPGANGLLPALSGPDAGGRLSFTDTSVALNWQGLFFPAGTELSLSLEALPAGQMPGPDPMNVSEPGFLILFGALIMLWLRRLKHIARRPVAQSV